MNQDSVAGTAKNLGGKVQEGVGGVAAGGGELDRLREDSGRRYRHSGDRGSAGFVRAGKRERFGCHRGSSTERRRCGGSYSSFHRNTSLYHGSNGPLCRLAYRSHAAARLKFHRVDANSISSSAAQPVETPANFRVGPDSAVAACPHQSPLYRPWPHYVAALQTATS